MLGGKIDNTYIIRGGRDGRERLRLLARVMREPSMALLSRAGVAPGARCLEVACGGGDLACDMARLVGPAGSVLGTDVDVPQLDIARAEALAQGLGNLQFECSDITQDPITEAFDVIHVRFTPLRVRRTRCSAARGLCRPGAGALPPASV